MVDTCITKGLKIQNKITILLSVSVKASFNNVYPITISASIFGSLRIKSSNGNEDGIKLR
jgi:hypothetical protein